MSKCVSFGRKAIEQMLKGLDTAADAVGATLGPCGLNVFIDNSITPKIINDGVSIAHSIELPDPLENAGAYLVKNTSANTNDKAGDGTTTTAVLLQAIIHECLNRPENPMVIRASLKEAEKKILKLLAKKSVKITKDDVEKVALVSSENKELAKLISEIINRLGEKAVIGVEDSKILATDYEIVDGYEAPCGYMSPHFVNDKSGKAIYENIPILVSEKKISNIQDIAPIFEKFKAEKISSCLIACSEIDDPILGILVANKKMGTFNSLVVRAIANGLEDIEGATGATAISDKTGVTFQNIELHHLGRAKKAVCDANKTLLLTDGMTTKLYAQELEKRAEQEANMYIAKRMRDRAAKLRGGVATLRIGAPTDFEREYLRLKAEDAVKAVQAALEDGIVVGGGMALWEIAQELKGDTLGEQILKRALTAPLRKIVENSGKDYAEVIKAMPKDMGYDAKNDCYAEMLKAGIIDPSKVERCVVENSISTASTFITTSAVITDIKKDDK